MGPGGSEEIFVKEVFGVRLSKAFSEALEKAEIRFRPKDMEKILQNLDQVLKGEIPYSYFPEKIGKLRAFMDRLKENLANSDSIKEFGSKVRIELSGNRLFFRSVVYEQKTGAAKKEEIQAPKTVVPTKFSAEGLSQQARNVAAALSKAAEGIPFHPRTVTEVERFLKYFDTYVKSKTEEGFASEQSLTLPFTSRDPADKFHARLVEELGKAGIKMIMDMGKPYVGDIALSKKEREKGRTEIVLLLPELRMGGSLEKKKPAGGPPEKKKPEKKQKKG